MSSNNVDERVVKMTFDNDQFEAGVKQTLTSLEELKESLKFNNSLTGIQAVSSAFNSFSLANITSQLDTLTNRFSTLGVVGMTAIENITNKVLNFASSKVTSTLGQITSGGWARASSIAQSRFTLQGLLEDEEKVNKAFESANEAVSGTAYSLNSAVAAASQLAASGVDVGEEMENTLKGIAGTAAMTGDSFDSIANIFTTVAGNGRLMGMQLTQLSAHGLNAAATIADYLGTTEAEVRDMTSKGEISFETFSKAMQKAFGEHAKDANKTFSGSMDNIKSALSRIGAIFSSGIIENDELITALNDVRKMINSIKDAMMPLEDKFKSLVSSVSKLFSSLLGDLKFDKFETFVDIIGEAMEYTASLADKWTELNEKFKESVFGKIAEEASEASEAVYAATEYIDAAWAIWNEGAYGVGETRRKALINAFGEEGADIVQGLVNQIAWGNSDIEHYDISLLQSVKDSVDEVTDSVEETGDAVEETAERFNPIVEILKALGHYTSGLRSIFNNIKTIVTKTVVSFKKVFSWQDLIQDITDYGDAFSDFFSKFELSEEQASKLETALTGLWSAIDLVRMVVKALVIGLSKSLGPVLSIIFDAVLSIAAQVGSMITGIQQWYRENDILRAALEFLGTVIKNVVEYVVLFFEKLDQLPAVEKIKEALSNLGELIGTTLTGFFGDATEATDKFFGGLEEGDSSKMETVLDVINTALENMIDFCANAQGSVSGFFTWLNDNISGLLGFKDDLDESGDKLTKLKGIGEKVVQSNSLGEFLSNISDGLSKMGLGVDTFVDWIIEKFNKLDAAKIAIIGLGSSLTAFGLSASYLSYNLAEAIKTFTAFPVELVNTVRSFRQVFTGISQYLKNDSQAKVLKNFAIAIGVMAASLFILTKFTDVNDLWKVAAALGALMIVMSVTAKLLSGDAAKFGSEKSYFKALNAMALFFISLAASAYILTESLKTLSNLKWDQGIIYPCLALVSILIALAAVVKISSDLDLDEALGKVGLGIMLFSAGVWLVAQAFKVLNDVELNGIADKVIALIAVMATLAVFSLAASTLKFTNALGVLTLIGSIWLIELALKDILYNGISLDDIGKNMDRFGAVLITLSIIALFMITVGVTCQKASNLAVNLIATAVSIYVVTKALEKLAEVPFTGILKALFSLAVIFVGIRMLINQLSANQIASNAGGNILKISIAIAVIAAVVALIGNLPMKSLAKGLLVVTVLSVLIGALIYVSQFSKDLDYKALYAIVAAIGVMALCVALISFIDDLDSVYAAAGIMSLMMLSLGMSLYLAGKYAKRLQTSHLVVMVTALVIIAGSLFLLSQYGDIGKMITAAASICTILIVIAGSLAIVKKALGNTDFTKNGRLTMLILMITMLAAVATALYFLSLNDPQSLAIAAFATIAVLGTVILLIESLANSIKKANFDTKIFLVMASVAAMLGVVAASLYIVLTATKDIPFENVLASMMAMATLMFVITGIVNYMSTISATYDLKTLFTVLSVIGILFAVALALKLVLSTDADWQKMLASGVAMAGVILVIAGIIAALTAITAGTGTMPMLVVLAGLSGVLLSLAATFLAFGKASGSVIEALERLAAINFENIDTGKLFELVLVLAGIAVVCAIAGPALISLALGITGLAISAAVLGAGLSVLAIPFAIITGLLVVMTNTFKLLAAVFKDSKDDIIEGLTSIGTGLANGIVSFIQTISSNANAITNAIFSILATILTGFIEFRNNAVLAIAEGILEFLDIVDRYGPQIATKATDTLLNILSSLLQNAGKIAVVGAYLVAAFVIGIFQGLSSKIGDILNAAMGFAISFIYGIADTIYENTQPLIDSMKYLGLVLVRELIAAFNIAGVFDSSLEEIDGEIEYQKSLREQEGAEAKEAFNEGVDSVDNAEIGEIDTSKTTSGLSKSGTEGANAYSSSFISGLGDKASEYLSGDKLTSSLGLGSGDGFSAAGLLDGSSYTSGFSKSVSENKVDVSSIPESVKSQLKDEGYTYSEDGKYLVKQIQAGSEEEAQDYGDFWTDEADPSLMSAMDETTENTGEKATEAKDNYIDGLVNLTDDDLRRIREEYARTGQAMVVGTSSKDGIDSNSPSKKAIQLGNYFVDGLIIGGEELSSKLSDSYAGLGNNAVVAAANSMSAISNVLQDDSIDWTPTLTPVIDSSQLQNGSNLLTATFGNSALNMAADTALSVKDTESGNLAAQVAALSEQVKKLADTDYSELLKGVNINVNAETKVDGTRLRKMASSYTIEQIDTQQSNYNMSRGARA